MPFSILRSHGSTARQDLECRQGIHRPTCRETVCVSLSRWVSLNLPLLHVRTCAGIPLADGRRFKPRSPRHQKGERGAHESILETQVCAPPPNNS